MTCPCDLRIHPLPLSIAAGQSSIFRQIATFPEFRAAMLAAISRQPSLAAWRARGSEDLGILLLEMWAYVCDSLSFYDEVIAHEVYLRTARRRPSLRKLTALLGYIPRPAVAATVKLAVLGEGRKAVTLPRGTGFRSGAFDGESPQTFELEAAAQIHPLANGFTVEQPRASAMSTSAGYLLLEAGSAGFKAGDVVVVETEGKTTDRQARAVKSAATVAGQDAAKYLKVTLDRALSFPANTPPAHVQISAATQKASLWTLGGGSGSVKVTGTRSLSIVLDGRYPQIKPGDLVVLAAGTDYSCYQVTRSDETTMKVTAGGPVDVVDQSGNSVSVVAPPVSTPATRLALSGDEVTVTSAEAASIVVHYNFAAAAGVTLERKTTLSASDPLQADRALETPSGYTAPASFLIEDKNGSAAAAGGVLNFASGRLTLDSGAGWTGAFTPPVKVYGNVVSASRGETVSDETLGSGDASVANQTFTLKKKPLTYKAAPTAGNERGVASSLKVYVDGILWSEVPTFFGVGPDEQAYIVRQDDDGESSVIFGDGRRGARLPTGTDNVVATYRYGAGAAAPPAGSITQLAKPVKGLASVRNPEAASGGDDADPASHLRTYAPRSALVLGRAVSLQDLEAVAAGVSGVRAVSVEWRWNAARQRPVVHVWYVGKASLATTVTQALRAVSDPTVPIQAEPAQGQAVQLSLTILIDARREVDSVLAAIRTVLLDKTTGLLAPERIGIGVALYRSRIFQAVLAVPGATDVEGILWNGTPFDAYALCPGSGSYFDLEAGKLSLSGKVVSHGG